MPDDDLIRFYKNWTLADRYGNDPERAKAAWEGLRKLREGSTSGVDNPQQEGA